MIGLEVVTQLLIGVYLLDADWPEQPLVLRFAILLGAAAFAALGHRRHDRRPHGGGLLGRRQRDLPSDGVHLRRLLFKVSSSWIEQYQIEKNLKACIN